MNDGTTLLYRGSTRDCAWCPLKVRCCPNTPVRKVPRSIYERARDVAQFLAGTEAFERSRHERKRIEMRFAHLKRILRLGRLRLRGPRGAQDGSCGGYRPEPETSGQAGDGPAAARSACCAGSDRNQGCRRMSKKMNAREISRRQARDHRRFLQHYLPGTGVSDS